MEKTKEERLSAFIEGFGKLREETGHDIFFFPVFVPTDHGTFEVVIQQQPIDIKDQPVKSPFVANA